MAEGAVEVLRAFRAGRFVGLCRRRAALLAAYLWFLTGAPVVAAA